MRNMLIQHAHLPHVRGVLCVPVAPDVSVAKWKLHVMLPAQDGDFFKPDSGKSKDRTLNTSGCACIGRLLQEMREKRAKESLKKGVARQPGQILQPQKSRKTRCN